VLDLVNMVPWVGAPRVPSPSSLETRETSASARMCPRTCIGCSLVHPAAPLRNTRDFVGVSPSPLIHPGTNVFVFWDADEGRCFNRIDASEAPALALCVVRTCLPGCVRAIAPGLWAHRALRSDGLRFGLRGL
jgi:hypothetical protein